MENNKNKSQVYVLLFKPVNKHLLIYATPDNRVILFKSKIDLATAFTELMNVIHNSINKRYNPRRAKEHNIDVDLAFSAMDAYASLIEIENEEELNSYIGNELVEYDYGTISLPALVILDDTFITDKEGQLLGSILADRFINEQREQLN